MTATRSLPKTSRRRKVALVLALAVVASAVFAYQHFTNPDRIRTLVESQLQRYVGGLVTVGRAELSLWHGATLFDVVIASPEPHAGKSLPPLFECRRIDATQSPWSAILGRPRIDALLAQSPKCTIVHDQTQRRTNLSDIVGRMASTAPSTLRALPLIELRDAQVRVIARNDERDREVQHWRLTVRGRASVKDSALYDVVWQSTELVDGKRAGGHSQLDLRSGAARNVDGGLPGMSIETVMVAVNAGMDGVGAWADLIGMSGDVRVTDYNLGAPAAATEGRSATIDLSDASLSLPVSHEESTLPHEQRYVQFHDVNGTATVTADRIVADFVGDFHGSQCQASVTIPLPITSKLVADFGFDMSASLVGLELPRLDRPDRPDEARAIRAWPAVARVYERYDPSGHADVELELFRSSDEPGPPRVRRFRITPRGASAVFHKFPYRIDHLTGFVEVTGKGGTLQTLRGDHHGADIVINGQFGKPGPCAPVEIHVSGTGVPLDDDLRAAISPAQRETWKLFEPVGTVDLEVDVVRPACTSGQRGAWSTTTTADFTDLSARIQAFPYPLQHLRGSVQLTQEDIVIQSVVSETPDTKLQAGGTMSFANHRVSSIQVQIDGTGVPFDDALRESLPEKVGHAIASFHPTGQFDFTCLLTQDGSANPFRHDTTVTLSGGTLRHDALPLLVTDVHGQLRITPDETVVTDVTGHHEGAALVANGRIDHALGHIAGTLTCHHLSPTEELYAALPPAWRRELRAITIDGNVDVEVTVPPPGTGAEAATPQLAIDFNGAAITLPQFAAPIEAVRGRLVVDASGARAQDLTGRFGAAELRGSVVVHATGDTRDGEIRFEAKGLALDESVRNLLPTEVQSIWDRLAPSGTVDLTVDSLRYTDPGSGTTPIWHGAGQARLRNVASPGVGDLDRATGVVTFDGTLRDRLGGTVMSGTVDLVGLRIKERKLTQVTSSWSLLRAADQTGRLALHDIQADLYGGAAMGSLEVMLESDGAHYELSTELQGVDLAPLMRPTRLGAVTVDDDDATLQGLTNAELDVSGVFGNARSRRGRASLEVTEGRIYKVPIVFAMLQVLNLAVPNPDTFDTLTATGFIDGDQVVIRDARIAGLEMALVGQGTVMLPNLAADFYFVSVNPNRWTRIPVLTDVIDRASRELVGLSVGGTLYDPIVQPRAFKDVSEELNRLFVPRKQKNSRAGQR